MRTYSRTKPKGRKPGRPPSPDGSRRDRHQVLTNEAETKILLKAAGKTSMSEYLRTAGLEKADLSKNSNKPKK